MPDDISYNDVVNDPFLTDTSKELFRNNYSTLWEKHYSDIVDNSGNQYVNLVQQGGGVWGVALAGYVYALEAFGIRFMRLAGTSAGAINTILLAAIGERNQSKSQRIKEVLLNWNFSEFMDGSAANTPTNKIVQMGDKGKYLGWAIIFMLCVTLCYPLLYLFNIKVSFHAYTLLFFPGFVLLLLTIAYYFVLRKNNFGINKGDAFSNMLTEVLNKEKAYSIADLNKKYNKSGDDLKVVHRLKTTEAYNRHLFEILEQVSNDYKNSEVLSVNELEVLKGEVTSRNKINSSGKPFSKLKADYTLITTDILSQLKVEFPKMANLYWPDKELEKISPANFVRASMSVPLFFKPLTVFIDQQYEEVIRAWKYWVNKEQNAIPKAGVFIDGGSISNFPIDIFHERDVIAPRLPVFGIRLFSLKPIDKKKEEKEKRKFKNNPEKIVEYDVRKKMYGRLLTYGGNILSTIRGFNDNSFLTKYSFYNRYSVSSINCYNSNWLNFKMKKEEKQDLFNRGFQEGINFLLGFKWEDYKYDRVKLALKERNILKDEVYSYG